MAVAEARHFRVLDQDRPARAGGPRRIRARCSVAPAYCPRPPRDLSLVASAPQRTDQVAPGTCTRGRAQISSFCTSRPVITEEPPTTPKGGYARTITTP